MKKCALFTWFALMEPGLWQGHQLWTRGWQVWATEARGILHSLVPTQAAHQCEQPEELRGAPGRGSSLLSSFPVATRRGREGLGAGAAVLLALAWLGAAFRVDMSWGQGHSYRGEKSQEDPPFCKPFHRQETHCRLTSDSWGASGLAPALALETGQD